MDKFLMSNTTEAKLVRTVVQGILSILMQNLADYLGLLKLTPQTVALLTPLLMTVLSALMSIFGDKMNNNLNNPSEGDLPIQANQKDVDEAGVMDTALGHADPGAMSDAYIERSSSNANDI